jgi:hypothetical protein
MVYLTDWGSGFDAPMDGVCQYLQTPEDHGNSHKGRQNVDWK